MCGDRPITALVGSVLSGYKLKSWSTLYSTAGTTLSRIPSYGGNYFKTKSKFYALSPASAVYLGFPAEEVIEDSTRFD